MTQPLRRLHFRMIIAVALLLPIVFMAGVLARHADPKDSNQFDQMSSWPIDLSPTLHCFKRYHAPDTLVYWSRAKPSSKALPQEALLLGSSHGTLSRSIPIHSQGYLLLYSLAHTEIVAEMPFSTKEDLP